MNYSVSNPKKTAALKHGIRNPESGIRNPETETETQMETETKYGICEKRFQAIDFKKQS